MEANKGICYAKGKCDVDHSKLIRWLKKFSLQEFEEPRRSGKLR